MGAPANFAVDYPVVLGHEARDGNPSDAPQASGFSNNPADPGGATQDGVTQRTYDGYRLSLGLPPRDVRQMDTTERRAIYAHFFSGTGPGSFYHTPPAALTEPLALIHFDSGFQSGAHANDWLDDSSGDPARYLALRAQFLANWIAASPDRQTFASNFEHRLASLAGAVSPVAAGGAAVVALALVWWLLIRKGKRP